MPVAVAAAVLPSAAPVAGIAAVVVATACAPDDDPGPGGVAAGSNDTSGGAAVAATFAEEDAALAGLVELGLSYVKSASMPSTEAVTTPPAIHCRRRRSWRGDESVDDSDVATRSDGVLGAGR